MAKKDDITFTILDASTMERLERDGEVEVPKRKMSVPKDERWNTKLMGSKLLQGIQNGDSVKDIAKSFQQVVDINHASAIRNARTMTTSAECHGRLDSYQNLKSQGVVQKKVWIATHDERTRQSHIDIDGEEVDVDANFSNDCAFPGDASADPSEVWNCRCSIRTRIVGFMKADGSISYVGKADEEAKPKERIESEKIKSVLKEEQYGKFMNLVNKADNSELYRKYADNVRTIKKVSSGGSYFDEFKELKFSIGKEEGMSEFSTIAHEYNHFFDRTIGRNDSLSFTEIDTINKNCNPYEGYNDTFEIIKAIPSQSDEFLSALREDMETLNKKGIEECYTEFKENTLIRNATGGVQDALDGFYHTQKIYNGWGHGDRYYNNEYNRWIKLQDEEKELKSTLNSLGFNVKSQAKAKDMFRQYTAAREAWANIGSAVTCQGDEYEAIQKYMPKTLEAYKKIVGGLKND